MTLTHAVAGVYDPVTGTLTGGSSQTSTVYGITTSYSKGLTNRPDSLIQAGDRLATIDALTTPAVGDSLTIQGVAWKIISIDPVDVQGQSLLFKCQVRK